MDRKRIASLVVITFLVVVIAVLLAQRRESATTDGAYGKRFFPELEQALNDITVVEIVQGATTTTLLRDGEIWGIKEKGGFGADFEKLKPLVLSIANLQRIEAKTSRPDQYEKIGVSDPSKPDAEHPGITLKNEKGAVIASLVVGDTRESDDGTKKLLYVRRLDEAQAWLVEGSVEVTIEPATWTRKSQMLDIYRSRIKSISVALADGDRYLLTRDAPDPKGFKYLPPPRNAKIRSFARLDDMAAALENVVPDDAFVAADFDFSKLETSIVEFKTFEGLAIAAVLAKKDDAWLVKYEAKLVGAKMPSADATAEDGKKLQLEADALSRELVKWVFVLPEARAALMTRKTKDVLAPENK